MATSILGPSDIPNSARQQRESQAQPDFEARALSDPKNSVVPSTNPVEQRWLSTSNQRDRYFQVSPYDEIEHFLDLTTVDTPNRLLSLALASLEPSTSHYATTPYAETFNWPIVFADLRSLAKSESFHFPRTEFYVVEFRSKLKETLNKELLFNLDKQSHREATASGGLLKYWFGSPDKERRNLATCLWRSKDDAITGGKGPWHKQARGIIASTYESINVHGLRLTIEEGAEGWKFEPYLSH